MPAVSFVFTNPRHHLDMMAPVARVLRGQGLDVCLVSLAELRGFRTPRDTDLPVRPVIPINLRRNPQTGAGLGDGTGGGGVRGLVRRGLAAVLVPATRRLVGDARVVVVPNDAAFPYDRLLRAFADRTVVLMQEGIRFAMPSGDAYGTGGAARICAWGEGSRDYFVARGAAPASIAITGSPRHDALDPAAWAKPGAELLARLGLAARPRPLAYLSNPIENQGYGTAAERLARFEGFVREVEPVLRAQGRALVVKNHASEDPAAYARAARATPAADLVHVDAGSPLFAALAVAAGAVVLTSTAGIEGLVFGVPLGALELPGGAFGFEYVERGAAVGLRPGTIAAGVRELLDGATARRAAADALVARHLHDRGNATARVAGVIAELAAR